MLGVHPALYARAFSVRVSDTLTVPVYAVDDVVGSVPSVVYRIVALEVAVLIATFCADAYGPVPGWKIGAIAFNSYAPVATSIVTAPDLNARTFSVRLCPMATVPPEATTGSTSVGVTPVVV